MSEVTAHHGIFHNTKLHVDDTGGPGRPVVLIHGWPLSGEAWKPQVQALQDAGYRVITYDRRGFGRSDKPGKGYEYNTLANDLALLIEKSQLTDVTLVGFSMGGGEVARYVTRHGEERLHSVVFAAAVPPYLAKTDDNPDGPLDDDAANGMKAGLKIDRATFFEGFMKAFYSAGEVLAVDPSEVDSAVALCHQSDQTAALGCMEAFGTTDFRPELPNITVPTLVIHGDSDGIVPFEGSGQRTHQAVPQSELALIAGAPHGLNVSHADEFNRVLIEFLAK